MEAPEYPYATEPTEAGAAALTLLQHAVYGSSGCGGGSSAQPAGLMAAAFCGSLAQAGRALALCQAALRDCLAAHSCLSVYNVAASCRAGRLAAEARGFALAHFPAAAALDYGGLSLLPLPRLIGLLCSDDLQVSGWGHTQAGLPLPANPAFSCHEAAGRRLGECPQLLQDAVGALPAGLRLLAPARPPAVPACLSSPQQQQQSASAAHPT